MFNFTSQNVTASVQVHDTGFGGYKYKMVCTIRCDAAKVNSLKSKYGELVLDFSNWLYGLTRFRYAYNPSLSVSRSKASVKTVELVYYFNDDMEAARLGLPLREYRAYKVLNLIEQVAS